MLLTNHTLTGIVLGLSISEPAVAFPLGLASHLLLDMTPHFGNNIKFTDRAFYILGSVDFTVSCVLAVGAGLLWPHSVWTLGAAILGAWLPDLTYIPVVIFKQQRLERWLPWYRPLLRFLAKIQWYERPPGLITEAVWAVAMLYLLLPKIHF